MKGCYTETAGCFLPDIDGLELRKLCTLGIFAQDIGVEIIVAVIWLFAKFLYDVF